VDGYLIPDHVYLCKTREGLLFLNLRTDKYLGVSGEGLEHLAALVPGWPIRPEDCDALETSERATRMARKLADAGLLTTDLTYGKSAQPAILETGASSLLQQRSPSRSRPVPLLLARLAYAALKVSAVLKFRSLEYAVREARRRKRATGNCDAAAIALSSALAAFAQIAPRQAKVVELRYFGGLKEDEIVEVLKVSPRTVRRDWEFARVWLARELHS